jgi:hypothetical protein
MLVITPTMAIKLGLLIPPGRTRQGMVQSQVAAGPPPEAISCQGRLVIVPDKKLLILRAASPGAAKYKYLPT